MPPLGVTTSGCAVVQLCVLLDGRFMFLTKLNNSCLFTWRLPAPGSRRPTRSRQTTHPTTHLAAVRTCQLTWRCGAQHSSTPRPVRTPKRSCGLKKNKKRTTTTNEPPVDGFRRSCSSEHDETRGPVACPLPLSPGAENSPP